MIVKMKKILKLIIYFYIILVILFSANNRVFATNENIELKTTEFTDEFKEWLELPEEERANRIQPKPYGVKKNPNRYEKTVNLMRAMKASTVTRYSLKDVIPNNIVIKSQKKTGACWAFAALASLETNIAMLNYKSGLTSKVYDYSERHMEYATSRKFLNNQENTMGYNRKVGEGGSWFMADSYLTNGMGAIDESEMPFENNENEIPLSSIQNKKVVTQVNDTKDFATTGGEEEKNQIKEQVQNNGAVYMGIHGASIIGSDCYNNNTGAIYCNDASKYPINHAVAIIGWDDDYDVSNFNEKMRPSSKGAWIVKNSWGEKFEYELLEIKTKIFESNKANCQQKGWNTAAEIPDSVIEALGFTISNGKATMKAGDNGIMYVSYEDCNVYKSLYAISKATDKVNYDNLYQYDELYPFANVTIKNTQIIMLATTFSKKTNNSELLTSVSLHCPETYTCKVYVNVNGTSKNKSDLQQIKLKNGDDVTLEAGYHTIEFLNPVELKSSDFTIVIEAKGTGSNQVMAQLESDYKGITGMETLNTAKIESGKCFVGLGTDLSNCTWKDTSKLTNEESSLMNGDLTIKAFTTNVKEVEKKLKSISINKEPTKTKYIQNKEKLDLTGGSIYLNYSDNTKEEVSLTSDEVSVSGFDNSKVGKNTLTVKYKDLTTTFDIEIVKEEVEVKEELPKNSNMDNIKCSIKNIKFYWFTDENEKEYYTFDTVVSSILKENINDSYEYYYCLSTNQNETDIENWVKIKETQTNDNEIDFQVNSKDVDNFDKLLKSESDYIYLYIKEVAIKGDKKATKVSKAMKFRDDDNTELRIYVDNEDITDKEMDWPDDEFEPTEDDDSDDSTSSNNILAIKSSADQTVATTKLPKTGIKTIIILLVIVICAGIGAFIKYKKLNKYVK